jgi:excisionase family DNA binding protein
LKNNKKTSPAAAQNNGKPQVSADSLTILTVPQVAERVQCSQRTVQYEIASGRLRAYRLGKKLTRIHRRDLDAYLERHATV